VELLIKMLMTTLVGVASYLVFLAF